MDGKVASSVNTLDKPDTTGIQPVRIGANSLYPRNYFNGFIDEVRIWNRSLSYSELLKGFENNTFTSTGQFVYLSLDEDKWSNSSITDSSMPLDLDGIYLNGSSYEDISVDTSQYTNYQKPFHLENTQTESPYYGAKAYETSYNNGSMNGFITAQLLNGKDGSLVMGYYDDAELPYYWELASQYVLADSFFAPTMDTGMINDQYLYTGTIENNLNNISISNSFDLNSTIFGRLEENGISWRVYVENYEPGKNYSAYKRDRFVYYLAGLPDFMGNKIYSSNIVDLVEYFRDLKKDDFPAVSYIVAPDSDESSPRDVSTGQSFVTSLVLALMKSKYWNDSAFIITYRESGGWYDHVTPPMIDGKIHGFRIPTLIISAFAKEGFVDSTFYDAASILKFIEYNYGLRTLAMNNTYTNNLLNAFDFVSPANEPLLFNKNTSMNIKQGTMIRNSENIDKVKVLYLIIMLMIIIIAFIIWRFVYLRNANLNIANDRHQ
jgi:phospholipase C